MATAYNEHISSMMAQREARIEDYASFRPTFYLGVGGFGCTIVRRLKREIRRLYPDQVDGFAFLGLDTHPQPRQDELTTQEYLAMSVGVEPKRAVQSHSHHLDWYPQVMGNFDVRSITGGANKVRPVGRLAFRNPPVLQEFMSRLESILTSLQRPRQGFVNNAPIKVYVLSTVAGGTGSGCLLDVLFLTGEFFRLRGGNANFPYQAILTTPEFLIGAANTNDLSDLRANSYSALKEIHRFLSSGVSETINYAAGPYSTVTASNLNLPQMIHLIGSKNEQGSTIINKTDDQADIIVAYLLSEVQTPMQTDQGRPKVQDLENQFMGNPGLDSMPRSFGSFGVVRTGVPDDVLNSYFVLKLQAEALAHEITKPTLLAEVNGWIQEQSLAEAGADQLQERLKREIRESLQVGVDARGRLLSGRVNWDDLTSNAQGFLREQEDLLLQQKKPLIQVNSQQHADSIQAALRDLLEIMAQSQTAGSCFSFLENLRQAIEAQRDALHQELAAIKTRIKEESRRECLVTIDNLATAVKGIFGRRGRTEALLDDLSLRIEGLLHDLVTQWVMEEGVRLYDRLRAQIGRKISRWEACIELLTSRLSEVNQLALSTQVLLNQMADVENRAAGNRFSLINAARANQLFDRYFAEGLSGHLGRIHAILYSEMLLEDRKTAARTWLSRLAVPIEVDIVRPPTSAITLNSVLREFYADDSAQRRLFEQLAILSSPLFFLDPNRREQTYASYWIVALHPDERDQFLEGYRALLPGQGVMGAFFESRHEVILYQLKMGYTIHSHQDIHFYESTYERQLAAQREAVRQRRPGSARPLHAWPNSENWPNLTPRPMLDRALLLFVVGRALSSLFPPASGRGGSYLYATGANYYLRLSDVDRPVLVGKGLEEAIDKLSQQPAWMDNLQQQVEAKIADAGHETMRARIESEYLPILIAEAEKAEGGRDSQRGDVLRRLAGILREYMTSQLRTTAV